MLAIHEPVMPRVQVGFIDRPVSGCRDQSVEIPRYGAPEISNVTVEVVNGLRARLMWPIEQYGTAAEKRFDVICNVAESRPHFRRNAPLTAEPRERCFHVSLKTTSAGNSLRCL